MLPRQAPAELPIDIGDLLLLARRLATSSGILFGALTSVAANATIPALGQKAVQAVEITAAAGAQAVVPFPASPQDGDAIWVKSVGQLGNAAPASLRGNGNLIEDPTNPGATASTVSFLSGQGQFNLFVFRAAAGVWRIYG